MKNSSKNKPRPIDYERFGRYMADVYETGYISKRRIYTMSFIKGILAGFGGVIGATILVALLLWLLSLLNEVPFLSDVVENIEATLQ